MGASAKICKTTLGICCYRLTLWNCIQKLKLILLIFEDFSSFFSCHFFSDKILTAIDNLPHVLSDSLKICIRQRTWKIKVIVKSILNSRPDCNLCIRKHFENSFSHDVGSRVPKSAEFNFLSHIFLLIMNKAFADSPLH